MDPVTRVIQAADGEDLAILACSSSTRVTDGQTDRQTELRWLKRATTVDAVARKNQHKRIKRITFDPYVYEHATLEFGQKITPTSLSASDLPAAQRSWRRAAVPCVVRLK